MESDRQTNVDPWLEERLGELWECRNWEPDTAKSLATFRRRRDSRKALTRVALLMTATLTAIFALLLMLPPTRVFAQRCVNACLAHAGVVKHAVLYSAPRLGLSPSELMPKQERKPAIDFALPDTFGRPIRLSKYRGLVVLLNFWATWCAPCNREIPWFNQLQQEHHEAGLIVFGVSLDEDGWRSVRPFLGAHQIDYPILLGDDQITRNYAGVEVLPTTFLIDRQGRVASMHHGLVEKQTYEQEIADLLREH